MKLGEQIRGFRQQRGLTQEALADQLEVSRQAVAKWERGAANPSTTNLIALSRIFEVSLEDLIPAQEEAEETAGRRGRLPVVLLGVALALLMAAVLVFLGCRLNAVPSDIIGYADAPTEIYLLGKPLLPSVLGGLSAVTALSALIVAWVQRRKRR